MKKLIVLTVAVMVLGAGAFAFFSRRGDDGTTYRFVTVEKGDLEAVVSATGTLSAVKTVQVGTQISGLIAKLYVDFNDTVRAGQVIALLDSTLLDTAVKDAEATLERNQAQLRQAQRDYERIRTLHEQGISADADFNTAQYNLDVGRAAVKSADAALARARQNLAYATITAPVSGTVVSRDVDVGQTVAASLSAPRLFLIANDLSEMQILASVDESDIGHIAEGQRARFTVKAYPDRTFTGTVKQVRLQSTVDQNVVNYTVVIAVRNDDGKLKPGMTATVEFLTATAKDVFKVANAALRFRPSEALQAQVRERMQRERAAQAGATGTPDGGAGPGGSGSGVGAAGAGTGAGAPGAGGARRGPGGSAGGPGGVPGGVAPGGPGTLAGGGAPGGRSGTGSGRPPRDVTILYVLDKDGKLAGIPVRTGITDGQSTEIRGRRLEAGMQIVVGMTQGAQSGASKNPFQPQSQTPGGPPGPRGAF